MLYNYPYIWIGTNNYYELDEVADLPSLILFFFALSEGFPTGMLLFKAAPGSLRVGDWRNEGVGGTLVFDDTDVVVRGVLGVEVTAWLKFTLVTSLLDVWGDRMELFTSGDLNMSDIPWGLDKSAALDCRGVLGVSGGLLGELKSSGPSGLLKGEM